VTKPRINVYIETALLERVEQYAKLKNVTRSFVIEAAVSAFFSGDDSEAIFGRRLDRLTRQHERLEQSLTILAEALAQYVRFWIITTTPPPSDIDEAMQAKARASVIREISDDLSVERNSDPESRPDGL
jgi:predicted transcriptional regulator